MLPRLDACAQQAPPAPKAATPTAESDHDVSISPAILHKRPPFIVLCRHIWQKGYCRPAQRIGSSIALATAQSLSDSYNNPPYGGLDVNSAAIPKAPIAPAMYESHKSSIEVDPTVVSRRTSLCRRGIC